VKLIPLGQLGFAASADSVAAALAAKAAAEAARDASQQARDAAAASAAQADAAKQITKDISQISTPDSLVKAIFDDPASQGGTASDTRNNGRYVRLPGTGRNQVTGCYHVSGYGAKGDGATDDTAAIQAALNAASAPDGSFFNGGTVLLDKPGATYVITQLRLKPGVMLDGLHASTVLLQKAGTTGDAIVLDTVTTYRTGVRNLTINCNSGNQTATNRGLYITHTGGDPNILPGHVFDHIHVRATSGDGIYLGDYTRVTHLTNFSVYAANGYGLVLAGADSEVSNGDVGHTGLSGVNIPGTSYLINNVKSWGTGHADISGDGGAGAGFWLQGNRNTLGNCYSQEAAGSGLYIFKSGGTPTGNKVDIISDGDNTKGSTSAAGAAVRIFNGISNKVNANVTNASNLAGKTYYGLDMTGSSSVNNEINLVVDGVTSWKVSPGSDFANSTIRIGGRENRYYQRTFVPTFVFGGTVLDADTHAITLTGNIVCSATNAFKGLKLRVILTQDATGGRTVTWGSGFKVPSSMSVSTVANSTSTFDFICDGTNWLLTGFQTGM
jgi:hypothetical protein